MTTTAADLDTAAAVLGFARTRRADVEAAEVDMLRAAVEWAVIHPVDSIEDAALVPGTEGELAIAGPGAPLVAEFCLAELATALGMSTDAGRRFLGQAVELRYRLPRLYARVLAGEVPAWKAPHRTGSAPRPPLRLPPLPTPGPPLRHRPRDPPPHGPTCPCNLAPLCRRHHRLKTHSRWTYTTPDPGPPPDEVTDCFAVATS